MRKLLVISYLFFFVQSSLACIGLSVVDPEYNLERSVFNGEEILIYWNEQKQEQHLIRKLSWRGRAKTMGFIVPLPTVPEIYEIDQNGFFHNLWERLVPEKIYEQYRAYSFEKFLERKLSALVNHVFSNADGLTDHVLAEDDEVAKMGVHELATQVFSDYKVITIKASDTDALKRWFQKHKFTYLDKYDDYLKSYIENDFILAIFIFNDLSKNLTLSSENKKNNTKIVGMRFKTDKPFHPYKEPKGTNIRNRSFRLHFLGTGQYDAFGEKGSPWKDKLLHSIKFEGSLGYDLPGFDWNNKNLWLTTFQDETVERKDVGDIYFKKAANSNYINKLPPVIVYQGNVYIPLDILFVIVGLIGFKLYKKKKLGIKNYVLSFGFFILLNVLSSMIF